MSQIYKAGQIGDNEKKVTMGVTNSAGDLSKYVQIYEEKCSHFI